MALSHLNHLEITDTYHNRLDLNIYENGDEYVLKTLDDIHEIHRTSILSNLS